MRATIVEPIVIDDDDRTVQPTIELYDDQGNLLQTTTDILIPIDTITIDEAVDRIKDLLRKSILARSDIPYTQTQINAMLLGMVVVVPE